MWLPTSLIIYTTLVHLSSASRILIANPYGTKSHQNVYVPLTRELAKRGHEVTIITNYVNDELTHLDNVQQIWMETLVVDPAMFPNPFSKPTNMSQKIDMIIKSLAISFNYTRRISETTYGDPRIKQMIATEKFDLVMISEVCGLSCYPLGWHFKAPTILLSPNSLFVGRATTLGHDEQLSYVPLCFPPLAIK